tara:strand:- start:395 stop:841 length:447 start_codon:yes stop_codon:yes gene_type:complete
MEKIPKFKISLIDGSDFVSFAIKTKTILFFYPKAMTPGCTIEVNDFQKHYKKFQDLGFTIIGCSKDTIENNIKFSNKHKLNYLLGSDNNNVCEKLGIWVEKNMYGKKYFGIERSTFMFDSAGNLFKKWNKVKVNNHVDEVLNFAKKCT